MNTKNVIAFFVATASAAGCVGTDATTDDVAQASVVGGPISQPPLGPLCDYPTSFGTPQNTGKICPNLRGMKVIGQYPQDDSVDALVNTAGFGQIHEGAPLTSGDFFAVPEHHAGNPSDPTDRKNDSYSVTVRRWGHGVGDHTDRNIIVDQWSRDTDWQGTDSIIGESFGSNGGGTNGYEMGFYPAIGNNAVYIPSRAGQLTRRDLKNGNTTAQINPFAGMKGFDGDARTIGISALQVAPNGNVYYNVIAYDPTDNTFGAPKRGSWLVEVHPDNTTRIKPYSQIATAAIGVPQASAFCSFEFQQFGITPTSSASVAPQFHCGEQLPAFNAPVAITPTGHIVTYTSGNTSDGAAFLIELDSDLSPVRSFDTRGHILNGCGMLMTDADDDFCSIITDNFTKHIGFDPEENEPLKLIGSQIMDSAPFVAPNGDVGIGGYTGGFSFGGGLDARGDVVVFKSDGTLRGVNQSYGFEVTPSVWTHCESGGQTNASTPCTSFSYVQDNNHFSDLELSIGQFSSNLELENNSTPDPIFTSNAIDFLDTNIVVDLDGRRYGVNGDGHVYAFDSTGQLVDSVALTGADGLIRSVETLAGHTARDREGRLYVSYAGSVYVIDGTGTDNPTPAIRRAASAKRSFVPKAHRGL